MEIRAAGDHETEFPASLPAARLPERRHWQEPRQRDRAPSVVRTAAVGLSTMAAVHAGAATARFTTCEGCGRGDYTGTVAELLFSPLGASLGALAVALGLVRGWKGARPLAIVVVAAFALTAPTVDQILFAGIETSVGNGEPVQWNGLLSLMVAAVNLCLLVLLTRPAARAWRPSPTPPADDVADGWAAASFPGAASRSSRPLTPEQIEARRRREAARRLRRESGYRAPAV